MGRFKKLLEGKGKDIKIGDETFTIYPLTGKHMGIIMNLGDKEKRNNAMIELIVESLRQSDPNITRDDINELPANILTEIIKTIMEVNELDE